MTELYFAEHRLALITKIKVDKSTNRSVWIKGKRHALRTESDGYFETWEAAYSFLLSISTEKLNRATMNLKYERDYLIELQKLKP